MFTRTLPLYVCALPLLAAATAIVPRQGSDGQCTTGELQCCQSVQSSADSVIGVLLGLLGISLGGVDVPIGVSCSPISGVGVGGNTCTSDPVCCDDTNNFNGVIAVNCIPISVSL